MKKYILFAIFFAATFTACRKDTTTVHQNTVDNYIYGIDGENLYQSNAEKNKQKSPEQYVSILYSNLFQDGIAQNDLTDLAEIRRAIGDKQLADELILNAFVNDAGVVIPTNTEMRENIEQFIENTYLRFFLRKPDPYEVFELKNEIENDTVLTPELIYQAFALSNEYKFY